MEIFCKRIKNTNYEQSHELLMKKVNKWVKDQGKGFQLISIDTWNIDSHFEDECEPWEAKIFYTMKPSKKKN